jgi:4-hydroxybenzoate polyprenyltransferase
MQSVSMVEEHLDTTPLVVDLDGTLLRSNLLHETVFALLRRSPLQLLLLPLWWYRGKARLKHELALRAELDVTTLPYDEPFLAYLREQKAEGRVLILATASNVALARRVAEHLGVFDAVVASDEADNLKGEAKLAALRERFGNEGFDYAGNEMADLCLWRVARRALLVGGGRALAETVDREAVLEQHFQRPRAGLGTYLAALRVHQWLKNLLVFIPLITAHRFLDVALLGDLVVAFFAFSLCASSVYVLNDLLDLQDDRSHPRKCRRPFAAGALSIATGCVLIVLLLAGAAGLALLLPTPFALTLGAYYATTLAYSLWFKRAEVLDVLVLAVLYTIRIVGGGVAAGIPLTVWLLGFSLFVFLSLAVAKRCAELVAMRDIGRDGASGRCYRVSDLPLLFVLGVGAGYVASFILVVYLTSRSVQEAYATPALLWVFCPMLLYWITRLWLKTFRGEMHDDPVVFAARDTSSRVLAVLGSVAILLAI